MQVLILAAGKSSRLYPFTSLTHHKAELVLGGKSLLAHTLDALVNLQPSEVILVGNPDNIGLKQFVQTADYPFPIHWIEQAEPKGQGDAILAARDRLEETFFVINPYNFNADQIIQEFTAVHSNGVVLAATPTDTPWMYGMVSLDGDRAVALVEKPTQPQPNQLKVLSLYQLSKAFVEFMATLPMEQYLLETALNQYMQKEVVKVSHMTIPVVSLKYPWHLFEVATHLPFHQQPIIAANAKIHPSAQIESTVTVDSEAVILEGAVIKGHSYIGHKVVVGTYSLIRDSLLETKVEVGYNSEITRSIIMSSTHTHGGGFIGDSLIGEQCRIGAGFITANKRFDRQPVAVYLNGNRVPTNLNGLGVIMGSEVKTGIQVGTMPGVVIAPGTVLNPGEIVKKNIELS